MGKSILDRLVEASRTQALDARAIDKIVGNGAYTDLWATERPLTGHWGSGQVLKRLTQHWGAPDIVFGKQDQVEGPFVTVDCDLVGRPTVLADWAHMPIPNQRFKFGYWDPPYLVRADSHRMAHYDLLFPCYREICRVLSRRLAILHPMLYPNPMPKWGVGQWKRIAVVGVTFGPLKAIRALQVWERL